MPLSIPSPPRGVVVGAGRDRRQEGGGHTGGPAGTQPRRLGRPTASNQPCPCTRPMGSTRPGRGPGAGCGNTKQATPPTMEGINERADEPAPGRPGCCRGLSSEFLRVGGGVVQPRRGALRGRPDRRACARYARCWHRSSPLPDRGDRTRRGPAHGYAPTLAATTKSDNGPATKTSTWPPPGPFPHKSPLRGGGPTSTPLTTPIHGPSHPSRDHKGKNSPIRACCPIGSVAT